MKCINDFFKVIRHELRKILKDQNLIMVFLLAPLVYPALYGSIYIKKIETDVPIAVRDDDHTSLSRALIREIDAHQNIKVAQMVFDQEEAEREMAEQKVFATLVVPNGFAKNIKTGKRCDVDLILSPGRMLVLGDVGIPVSQIVSGFSGKITASVLAAKGVPVFENKELAQPVKLEFQNLFNPYQTYGDLILPGIMAIIVLQLVLISVTSASAKEWSLNKWGDLFSVTRNTPVILLAKIIFYCSAFLVFSLFSKLVYGSLFDIRYVGGGWDLFVMTMLGIISATSLGLFIGTYFHHRITTFVVLGFTSYPMFMLSGFAWPAGQLPEIVRLFSYAIPLTPFLNSLMKISQMGNDLSGIQFQIWNMLILTAVYLFLAFLRYEKLKRQKPAANKFLAYLKSMPR